MLTLHTSDWHLGRALHGFDLSAAQAAFVDHLVEVVRVEQVDLVVVAGDVHDRAIPPVAAMRLFDEALSRMRDAGARVVVISGNHDAPARLGDKAGLLDPRVRIRTEVAAVADPVTVEDSHGPVHVYAIPYLEPAAVAAALADTAASDGVTTDGVTTDSAAAGSAAADSAASDTAGTDAAAGTLAADTATGGAGVARTVPAGTAATHASIMRQAMRAVHAARARHGGRSIVCAHAWVHGGKGSDSERDISVGGLAAVPADLFTGITYTALGHLHKPQALRDDLRYSGSPLAYSFSEAADAKSSLLVELDATGLAGVEEIPVPLYRSLARLRGTLADLMTSAVYEAHTGDFVSVVLTDPVRPMDAMTTLQRRFPHALTLSHEPVAGGAADGLNYRQRIRGRTDLAVAEAFLTHVRAEPDERERSLLRAALDDARLSEDAA
ncbi:exonuclease SbcCD subunit D [Frankia sp. Cj5]|uniref:exonuclease SbcCD subunit D n=3 Tax=unclassified Frankia TaxID=2632575 RepID=UPI001EF45B49|nr:exonuclease SbcCD subunit D [Frankia sp. Cj5]